MEIREQTYGVNYGSGEVILTYPGVSSCMTLTYYYTPTEEYDVGLLAGLHVGLYNHDDSQVSRQDVGTMFIGLNALAPRGVRPSYAFLIGQYELWRVANADVLFCLRDEAQRQCGRKLMDEEFSDASDHNVVTIKILTSGVVRIKPTAKKGQPDIDPEVWHFGNPLNSVVGIQGNTKSLRARPDLFTGGVSIEEQRRMGH